MHKDGYEKLAECLYLPQAPTPAQVERAMVHLQQREGLPLRLRTNMQLILLHRFGLLGRPWLTQKQLGEQLALGAGRIGQIEAQTLRILRHPQRRYDIWAGE